MIGRKRSAPLATGVAQVEDGRARPIDGEAHTLRGAVLDRTGLGAGRCAACERKRGGK